ncbi:hypothetical protein [Castellaniella sp.]|uniref:hypothetical protein n=1 Tax=Castellaniella sp. TaxID=1955812 RepID=UPI002AFDDC65|nr:hypothetical protein [Castellaniella sp.]
MKLHESPKPAPPKSKRPVRFWTPTRPAADQQAKFDALKAEIQSLEQQEARQAFIDEAERRTAGEPVDHRQAELESRVTLTEAIMAKSRTGRRLAHWPSSTPNSNARG